MDGDGAHDHIGDPFYFEFLSNELNVARMNIQILYIFCSYFRFSLQFILIIVRFSNDNKGQIFLWSSVGKKCEAEIQSRVSISYSTQNLILSISYCTQSYCNTLNFNIKSLHLSLKFRLHYSSVHMMLNPKKNLN